MVYVAAVAICLWVLLVLVGVTMVSAVALNVGSEFYDPAANARVVAFTGFVLTVAGVGGVLAIGALLQAV